MCPPYTIIYRPPPSPQALPREVPLPVLRVGEPGHLAGPHSLRGSTPSLPTLPLARAPVKAKNMGPVGGSEEGQAGPQRQDCLPQWPSLQQAKPPAWNPRMPRPPPPTSLCTGGLRPAQCQGKGGLDRRKTSPWVSVLGAPLGAFQTETFDHALFLPPS